MRRFILLTLSLLIILSLVSCVGGDGRDPDVGETDSMENEDSLASDGGNDPSENELVSDAKDTTQESTTSKLESETSESQNDDEKDIDLPKVEF